MDLPPRLPFRLLFRMACAVHGTVRAAAPAGGVALLFVASQVQDNRRYNDNQRRADEDGGKVRRNPGKHTDSSFLDG